MMLTTSTVSAISIQSWHSKDFIGEGIEYYTEEFYNESSVRLRLWVEPSNLDRTYTFELQRLAPHSNATWETVDSKSGNIKAGDVFSDNWSYNNPGYYPGNYRYILKFSSYSYFDGTVRYYY